MLYYIYKLYIDYAQYVKPYLLRSMISTPSQVSSRLGEPGARLTKT